MRKIVFGAFAFSMVILAGAANATVIDFEDFAVGSSFAVPFATKGVSFGSPDALLVTDIGTGNALCGASNGSCIGAIGMDFGAGARSLSFSFSGDSDPTTQLILEIEATVLFNGQPTSIQQLGIAFADGDPLDQQVVRFQNPNVWIDSIVITSLDATPFVIDNLSFDAVTAAVPEPATWTLLIAGFGMTGAAARRRVRTLTARS